jgi:hypothetical protein
MFLWNDDTTWHNILEDGDFYNHQYEKVNSYVFFVTNKDVSVFN